MYSDFNEKREKHRNYVQYSSIIKIVLRYSTAPNVNLNIKMHKVPNTMYMCNVHLCTCTCIILIVTLMKTKKHRKYYKTHIQAKDSL